MKKNNRKIKYSKKKEIKILYPKAFP